MKWKIWLFFPLISLVFSSLTYSSEIMFPATQIETRLGSLAVYSANSEKKFNFQVKSDDEIKAVGYSIFKNVTNDIESSGKGSSITAKYIVSISAKRSLWLKAGLGNYEIELPSTTVKNNLSGGEQSYIFGVGYRSRLFPDTIVSPAISVEFGVNYESYKLNKLKQSDSVSYAIDKKLELLNMQAAVVVSKRIPFIEPYGGLKVFRTNATITDNLNSVSASGIRDNASLFLGAKADLFDKQALMVEVSFVGETTLAAGWNIYF